MKVGPVIDGKVYSSVAVEWIESATSEKDETSLSIAVAIKSEVSNSYLD